MAETITVEINNAGEVKVSVKGVKGAGCLKATADLEKALGKTTSRKHTEEMREKPQVQRTRGRG